MRFIFFTLALALSVATSGAGQIPSNPQETFSARAEAKTAGGVAVTILSIHVDRYTNDTERHAAVTAFEQGGSAGLTAVLRNTPSPGYVQAGDRKWAIRYACQEPTPTGRRIVIVLDQPMFIPGGGDLNSRRREWFDVAVIQFEVDGTGAGQGTMAAAASIRAVGPAGVELTDDSDATIILVTVAKVA